MNAQKANYKIFNTRTQKYVSKSRGKATWSSKSWVIEAAKDSREQTQDLEIHVFPVQSAIKVPYNEFFIEYRKETETKRQAKIQNGLKKSIKREQAILDKEIVETEKRLAELKAKRDDR
jgi:hypothetical protein